MKKLIIFTLTILFLCLLTGCDESQAKAYDLYIKMAENVANAKSIDMDVIAVSESGVDEEVVNSFANGNVKKIFHSDTDVDLEINLDVGITGETMVNTTSYYRDGLNYFKMSGADISDTKFKSETSVEEALHNLPGISHTDLLEFPEDAIKSYKISNHDGGKKVELTLYGNAVTSLLEENVIISDVICEFIIDKKNMLKSYTTIYEKAMTITIEEVSTINISRDITIKVNLYDDVTINFPDDLDEYVYVDRLSTPLFN